MKLGLTGGMGCGKSKVARILQHDHGFVWIDMDAVVHELYTQSAVIADIEEYFSEKLHREGGEIDRIRLSHLIAQKPGSLEWLEAYIHPKAFAVVKDRMADAQRVVVEVPLLFEVECEELFDMTVCVSCSPDILLKRLKDKRGLSEEEIERRNARQLPLEEKMKRADYVLSNETTKEVLKAQVDHLMADLHE